MGTKKIFISYSRRDTDYVKSLVEALRKQGFEVWFDKNIRTGTDWDDTIETELKNADAIVLILSKTSVASENVKDEISYAIGLDKPVNPIKIEECEVPMRLARKQFVDFTILGPEAGFERLVNDLNFSLNEAKTNVPKGTFTPPKSTESTANNTNKPSKKIAPYLIGGIVALILFIVFIVNCTSETVEDSYQNEVEMLSQDISPEWEKAINANTINGYLGYIYDHGPNDINYQSAQDSIDTLMPFLGMGMYSEGTDRYFVKNLYTDMNGDTVYQEDDNEIPKKGDIITALKPVALYDTENADAESVILEPGEKARVLSVRMDGEAVWVMLQYPEM
ncbi:toll/interleukin-1 receptor domain-containing protein [Aequorivita sp. SDUM287046]|uniref:Toll/interleukin-1 receptor domain-containing protein n=1 Tax=Aequorivita aurantiaca TaxID=3053356 RepID=A0ABT8DFB6_9FLAO|nr:toll/interleukin-1 receptor domain-containing protein [Aequorivita aurantiaca]MDN3723477.1 toll/interleukin-1 receptor domain-containing protein [Aequorivita aurantiaca]